MNQPLAYMDGETLMNTVLPPIRFVISQLLPQGLHILVEAPKVGMPCSFAAARSNGPSGLPSNGPDI